VSATLASVRRELPLPSSAMANKMASVSKRKSVVPSKSRATGAAAMRETVAAVTGAAATREAVAAATAAAASRVARGSGAAPARNPLQVRFVLNPWQTASILHHSMSNEATQLELALLAPHMADMVAPSVQDPLRLHFNPVGILHGTTAHIPLVDL